MTRSKVLMPIVFFAAIALAAACGYLVRAMTKDHATAPAARSVPTKVSECGVEKPIARPKEMTMTCGDGGAVLHDIDWRLWGSDIALGVGTTSENTCDPSCADGVFVDHPVNVVIFGAISNGYGPQFSRATVTYQDDERTADEKQAITYDLPPYKSE